MSLNVELLEQSFAAVAPHADQLADTFYGHLFADYPEVLPMFQNTNMADQKKKLVAALTLVVENLRRPDVLIPTLERMGAAHADFGTREEHYPAVGATLLKSLAEVAGDLWNDELNQAWADAYGVISETMLAGTAVLEC